MKKTLIWIASVIGAAAVVVLAWTFCMSYQTGPRTVAVSGECLTTAPKDRTAITLRVRALDMNAAVSMKMASAKMSEITAFLKTLDVEMQTTQFDSYEKTEWDRNEQKSVTLGIETNIAVEVSASKMETIEVVLAKFAGVENVYTENLHMFTSAETMKPIMENCLGVAVKNARQRAEAIAIAEGKKVGKLVAVEYGNARTPDVRPTNFLRAAKMEATADVAYAGGGFVSKDTEVSVGVSAVFEIR